MKLDFQKVKFSKVTEFLLVKKVMGVGHFCPLAKTGLINLNNLRTLQLCFNGDFGYTLSCLM